MTKKQKPDRLVAEPKEEGLAVFSYDGIGLALRIGDHDMDTVFDIAKEAIKKQQEKTEDGRQEKGEEVRTEDEERTSSSAESVDRDTSAGGVSSEVHGPNESDVR